jgi:hypothetical protein
MGITAISSDLSPTPHPAALLWLMPPIPYEEKTFVNYFDQYINAPERRVWIS